MAEIGLVASIIAVTELIGKTMALGYSYIRGVKRAPKDLIELVGELGSLKEILIVVKDLAGQNPQLHALQTLNSNDGPLHGIAAELNKLISKLEPTNKKGFKGSMERLKWPLQEAETMQHISRIERHKTSFILALSADQISISNNIAKDLQGVNTSAQEIQRLAQNTNLTIQDINSLIQSTGLTIQDIQRLAENTNLTLDDIQDLVKKTNCAVNDSQKLTQNTNLVLQAIKSDINHASRIVETIKVGSADQNLWRQKEEDRQRAEKREKVLNWLSSEDFQSKHAEISKRRQQNTGKWIFRTPQYQGWLGGQNNGRLLWGCGIPGAGKTFLSSSVVDDLESRAKLGGYGVGYIYFDYQNQTQQSPDHVIASLVKQLAYQLTSLPTEIEALHRNREHEGKRPTTKEVYSALLATAKSFTQVFLVFDALDEYNEENQRGELLEFFHDMEGNGINLFMTSRPHPEDVQESLQNAVRIEIVAKEGDIRAYIEAKVGKNPRAKRLICKGNLKDRIMSELVDCAQGMFLLVHFHIEYICQQTTINQILKTLEGLKNSFSSERPLDPTYDRAMGNIRRQSRPCMELALRVFSWLVKARRTLTVDEVQIAVSIEQGLHELGEEDLPNRNTLLDVCAGLVVIDEDSMTVRLAHYTVQDYLTRTSTVPPNADFLVATTCITYLLFDVFAQGACASNDAFKARCQSHPFLDYSVHQLRSHLKMCEEELSRDLVHLFVGCSGSVSSYLQALHFPDNSWKTSGYDSYPKGWHPLHVAAALGQNAVIRILLDDGACISALDSHQQTALHIAAAEGQDSVIGLLVQKGADTSLPNYHGQTALHMAASGGHKKVVQVLVENGADISTHDYLGYTALHYATTGGFNSSSSPQPLNLASKKRMEVIRVLFDKGASVSATTNSGRTALHIAVYRGNEEAAQLLVLLAGEAGISAQDNDGQTPLHLATSRLNERMSRILVEGRADPSIRNNKGYSALHIATMKGHLGLTELFLKNGADYSTLDCFGNTPLSTPLRLAITKLGATTPQKHQPLNNNHEQYMAVSQLLLRHGADLPAAIFLEELRKAVVEDRVEVVRLLSKARPKTALRIDGYALVKSTLGWGRGNGGWPSLIPRSRQEAMVKVLYETMPDCFDITNLRGIVLKALTKRSLAVIELVINVLGSSALYLIMDYGDRERTRSFLDSSTNTSTTDDNGQTVLHLAMDPTYNIQPSHDIINNTPTDSSRNGGRIRIIGKDSKLPQACLHPIIRETIVKVILDSGVDVSALDKNGKNALHLAINGGWSKAIVKLLLDSGADASAIDKNGNNALHLAINKGWNEAGVKLLLDSGADPSALDRNGNNALHLAVGNGGWGIAKLLLDSGSDPSSLHKDRNSALHLAIRKGLGENVIKSLLDSGADASALDKNGRNALHFAVGNGESGVVKLLLDNGTDISTSDTNGATALHWAAIKNQNEAVVQLLLGSGADVFALDTNGATALHWAAANNQNEAVVQLLLDSGADVSIPDTHGATALHWAAANNQNEAVVKLLLDSGAGVSFLDANGNSTLHWALRMGRNEATVKLLLDSGAEASAVDMYGNNALYLAVAMRWNKTTIEHLIGSGVDVSALDYEGNTILHLAARSKDILVFKLLLDSGVDTSIQNKNSQTALEVAVEYRNDEIVKIFHDRGHEMIFA